MLISSIFIQPRPLLLLEDLEEEGSLSLLIVLAVLRLRFTIIVFVVSLSTPGVQSLFSLASIPVRSDLLYARTSHFIPVVSQSTIFNIVALHDFNALASFLVKSMVFGASDLHARIINITGATFFIERPAFSTNRFQHIAISALARAIFLDRVAIFALRRLLEVVLAIAVFGVQHVAVFTGCANFWGNALAKEVVERGWSITYKVAGWGLLAHAIGVETVVVPAIGSVLVSSVAAHASVESPVRLA